MGVCRVSALNRQTKGVYLLQGRYIPAGVLGLHLADNTCCGVHREPAQSTGPHKLMASVKVGYAVHLTTYGLTRKWDNAGMGGGENFTSERRKIKSCFVSQERQEEQLSPSIPRCHKQDNNLPSPTESHVQGRALPALDMGSHITSMTPPCRYLCS